MKPDDPGAGDGPPGLSDRLWLLAEASRAFAAAELDLGRVADALARQAAACFPGSASAVLLVEEEGTRLELAALLPDDPDTAAVLRGAAEVHGTQGAVRALARRFTDRRVLTVPLRGPREVVGVLLLVLPEVRTSGRAGERLPDEGLLEELADRATLAIANARSYRRAERELRRTLADANAARREAEVQGRMKDEFVAKVSHELRTPLGAIFMWAHVLRSGEPADRDAALDAIEASARVQSRILADLLDLSRAIGGKLLIELEQVALGDTVAAALEALRPEAARAGVTLELDVPHDEMRVMGDGVRLQQVVSNLVSNGVKFTPRGGRVGVRLCRVGDSAEIAVSDTGRGLSPEAPEEIFTPFRQVGELAGPSQGGLGLGLAIVRQLVELHRGTVRAESAGPGRGSCFTVKLPLSPVRAAPLRPGGRESSLTPPPQIRGVEVLLVEDDGYTRRGLERVLVQAGADVTVAGTAAEAVEALDRKRFDVLLCDLALPDGTGFDLLPRLRARDRGGRERLRAVAVTALAGERDRERALKAGFDAHLAKPTDVRDLLRAVARLSGRLDPP